MSEELREVEAIAKLKDLSDRLSRLLETPEPGLAFWWGCVGELQSMIGRWRP